MTQEIVTKLKNAMFNMDAVFSLLSRIVKDLNNAREVGDNSAVTSDIIEHCRQAKDLIVRDIQALTAYSDGVKDIDETQKQP